MGEAPEWGFFVPDPGFSVSLQIFLPIYLVKFIFTGIFGKIINFALLYEAHLSIVGITRCFVG
jgi:hypothetical protein